MSKIRQSVQYERQIAKREVEAHEELTDQAFGYERTLTDQKIDDAIHYRDRSLEYERKITDAQFETLRAMSEEHRVFHEREHILYDDAVDKASGAITAMLEQLRTDFDRLEAKSHDYMTTGRFEREHGLLIERIDTKFETYDEKIGTEEKVTVKQQGQQELLEKINTGAETNRRWLIGLAVASLLSLLGTSVAVAALLLHLAKVY